MKKWEQSLVSGAFGLVIGVVLLAWAFQAVEPIELNVYTHKNIIGEEILDRVETGFGVFFILPLVGGILLIGVGIAEMGATWDIRKLEKQIEGLEPKDVTKPEVKGKLFCRYCGKENKPDAIYCEGCGKNL